ncbi:hypothetical protein BJY04DRAFT_202474 [Aspergillus karnatakaensis]|uniref:uncharacterized protein n=1 Tax=Aspergillus karnatakaensis TaxID=1810916 RepID=UPI003CCCCAC6
MNQPLKFSQDEVDLAMKMPPELIMIILDNPPESKQIRRLMWAVRVPVSYWRRRFIKEFMLEDEEMHVRDTNNLNWHRLYYKTARIRDNSHGLQNRKRILDHLQNIKANFLYDLSKSKSK